MMTQSPANKSANNSNVSEGPTEHKSYSGLTSDELEKTKDYSVLIKNLRHVLNTIGFCIQDTKAYAEGEEMYKELCQLNASRLSFIVGNEMYTQRLDNHIDKNFTHEVVFHLCRANPVMAGKLLNKHINKFWHHDISESLIRFGADVNAVDTALGVSTLYHAVQSSVPAHTIRQLVTHGAKADMLITADETNYPLMVVAALDYHQEALSVLVDLSPKMAKEAIQFVEEMERKFETDKFPCVKTDYVSATPKAHYTLDDIHRAKQTLLQMKFSHSCFHGKSVFDHKVETDLSPQKKDEVSLHAHI